MSPRLSRRGGLSVAKYGAPFTPFTRTWTFETNLKDDETDSLLWFLESQGSTLTRSNAQSYAGSYSMAITTGTFGEAFGAVDGITMTGSPPTAVNLSFWYYVPTSSWDSLTTGSIQIGNFTGYYKYYNFGSPVKDAWTEVTMDLNTTEAADLWEQGDLWYLRARISGGLTSGYPVYWDDITIDFT